MPELHADIFTHLDTEQDDAPEQITRAMNSIVTDDTRTACLDRNPNQIAQTSNNLELRFYQDTSRATILLSISTASTWPRKHFCPGLSPAHHTGFLFSDMFLKSHSPPQNCNLKKLLIGLGDRWVMGRIFSLDEVKESYTSYFLSSLLLSLSLLLHLNGHISKEKGHKWRKIWRQQNILALQQSCKIRIADKAGLV